MYLPMYHKIKKNVHLMCIWQACSTTTDVHQVVRIRGRLPLWRAPHLLPWRQFLRVRMRGRQAGPRLRLLRGLRLNKTPLYASGLHRQSHPPCRQGVPRSSQRPPCPLRFRQSWFQHHGFWCLLHRQLLSRLRGCPWRGLGCHLLGPIRLFWRRFRRKWLCLLPRRPRRWLERCLRVLVLLTGAVVASAI